ncbi:MAG: D-2-hydroxyacid dehydrogenase [Vicinamibacterales bacterium]
MKLLVANYSRWVAWDLPEWVLEQMRAAAGDMEVANARTPAEAVALIADADIAFSSVIRPDMLAAARRLRWIHSPAAGVGGMLFPEMRASEVVITNSRGMHAETIAEHVVAVVLALFRRLPTAIQRQSERAWAQDELTLASSRLVARKTVGIVGLGGIGSAVARAMSGLGARVEATRRRLEAGRPEGVVSVHPPGALGDLLPRWDVVVLSAPHTAETERLIGARELGLMKRDAVLVNIARGPLVDQAALADALTRGAIAGAALDVFDDEPLESTSPLWDTPNLLITPHVAGNRPDYWEAALGIFLENLRRFRAGEALLNVVDKEAGY